MPASVSRATCTIMSGSWSCGRLDRSPLGSVLADTWKRSASSTRLMWRSMLSAKRGSIWLRTSRPSSSDHISPTVSSPTRVTTPPMSFRYRSRARHFSCQCSLSVGGRSKVEKVSPASAKVIAGAVCGSCARSYMRALASTIGLNAGCAVTSATRSPSIQTSRPSRSPARYSSPVRIIPAPFTRRCRIIPRPAAREDRIMLDEWLQPIEGPVAWRGAELARDPSWRRTLTAEETAALERAAAAAEARGLGPTGFAPAEFRVPELRPLFSWLADRLESGPGVARVSGMPVDRLSHERLRRLFGGFCVNLGTPMYQTAAGEILGEVKDETGTGAVLTYDGPGPLKSARTIARSAGPLRFHTDKTDMICLLCASNGIAGGLSKVVSSVTIHNEIARRCPDLLRVLYEPYWRMRPYDEEGDAERDDRTFPMPVFARGPDGSFTSQYSRTYISQAQEVPTVPRLSPAQVEAMDMLHAIGEEVCLQM